MLHGQLSLSSFGFSLTIYLYLKSDIHKMGTLGFTQATACCEKMGTFLRSLAALPRKCLGECAQVEALRGDHETFSSLKNAAMLPKESKFALRHASWFQGSSTLGQILTRELKPGETRLGLVGRCQLLLDRKGLGVEPALKQRAMTLQKAK